MSDQIDYSIGYRRWHDGSTEELVASDRMFERWIGSTVREHPSSARVLDYGCGYGLLTHYLSKHFQQVQGLDASAEQIAVGIRNGLPVAHLPVGDFSDWCETSKDSFDVIFMFDVLEHVPVDQQIGFLRGLQRTLKVGGKLYVKVPNANSLLASRWRYIDWTHCSSFTECSLEFVLLNTGFAQVMFMPDESSVAPRLPFLPRWGLRNYYARSIVRWLWKRYLFSELGSQARDIQVGYNLFAAAVKV